MATTGFWPVKGSLKDLLNYAENPERTILKDEIYSVLEYAPKTEELVKQFLSLGYEIDTVRMSVKVIDFLSVGFCLQPYFNRSQSLFLLLRGLTSIVTLQKCEFFTVLTYVCHSYTS